MEMHQVRYFLAVCRTLNFTRAAEECNVAQPSLSRAIKQLEEELGGELFRRERTNTHMTDLGRAVLPSLRQCYESSLAAKAMARAYCLEGHAPLQLALSRSLEMEMMAPLLEEITRAFPAIEIKIFRGPAHEIVARLKSGDAEIALSGPLDDGWERLDLKPLFRERFGIVVTRAHRLARTNEVELEGLAEERLLCRPHCAMAERLVSRLGELGVQRVARHEVPLIDDLTGLVRASFGVGILPVSRRLPDDLQLRSVHGVDLSRPINVYTVAGRPSSSAASALKTLLRSRDWAAANGDQVAAGEVSP